MKINKKKFPENSAEVLKIIEESRYFKLCEIGLLLEEIEPEYFFGSIPDYSFPSLQTAVAFAAIPFLWNMFQAPKYWSVLRRKARILFVSYAVIIMWSRVILQEHYASDVIVGALIGISTAAIIQKMIK